MNKTKWFKTKQVKKNMCLLKHSYLLFNINFEDIIEKHH